MTAPSSPEAQIPSFAPGRDLARRYRLIESLAVSWSQATWSAYDLQSGGQVALHVLPLLFLEEKTGLDELRRRTAQLAEQPHPGLVRGLDYFATEEAACGVDELLRGVSLAELRHLQPGGLFTAATVLDRMLEACAAIGHLHGFGWAHGDLHPGQLLVDATGRLRVTGLGVAQIVSEVRFPETGAFALAHSCKSPQQLAGEMAAPPDDVYALGAAIFHLLTGQLATSPNFARAPGAPLPPMGAICERLGFGDKNIDPRWDELVRHCLTQRREERPAMAQVAEALRVLKPKPAAAPAEPPPAIAPEPAKPAEPKVIAAIPAAVAPPRVAHRRTPAGRPALIFGSAIVLGLAAALVWTKVRPHGRTPAPSAKVVAIKATPPAETRSSKASESLDFLTAKVPAHTQLPVASTPLPVASTPIPAAAVATPPPRGHFHAELSHPDLSKAAVAASPSPVAPAPHAEKQLAQAEFALLEQTRRALEGSGRGRGLTLPPLRKFSDEECLQIGKRLWKNEGAGTAFGLTTWRPGEDCATLGIGRFLWFPPGATASRDETFPDLMQYFTAHGMAVPEWLKGTCPWTDRDAFMNAFREPPMNELRELLKANIALQSRALVERLPRTIADFGPGLADEERAHVQEQYTLLAKTSRGLFVMIDFLLWQGADPALRQALLEVKGKTADDAPDRFSDAAERILKRRGQAPGEAKPDPVQQRESLARVHAYTN